MTTPRLFSTMLLLALAVSGARGQEQKTAGSVVGAGGGSSGNGGIVLRTTVGQPIIGDAAAQGRLLQQGFWLRTTGTTILAGLREAPTTGLSLSMRAYPNPFSASTELVVTVPVTGRVVAQLHDARGNAIRTLIDATVPAGTMKIAVDGGELPSGNYVVTLNAGGRSATTILRLVK